MKGSESERVKVDSFFIGARSGRNCPDLRGSELRFVNPTACRIAGRRMATDKDLREQKATGGVCSDLSHPKPTRHHP